MRLPIVDRTDGVLGARGPYPAPGNTMFYFSLPGAAEGSAGKRRKYDEIPEMAMQRTVGLRTRAVRTGMSIGRSKLPIKINLSNVKLLTMCTGTHRQTVMKCFTS